MILNIAMIFYSPSRSLLYVQDSHEKIHKNLRHKGELVSLTKTPFFIA